MALGFTTVRVNIGALIIDGIDVDDSFDDVPVSGKMILKPRLETSRPLQVDDGGVMKIKAVAEMEVDIGLSGDISHRNRDYVTVPAPTSATSNVAQLQWEASFPSLKYGLKAVTVPSIYFWAEPGASINLADFVNVAPVSTAVQLSRGARGYGLSAVDADGAALVFYSEAPGEPEVGRVELPPQEATVGDDSVTSAKLAPAVRTSLAAKVDKTLADTSYAAQWIPSTLYAAGKPVMLPTGKIGTRTASGTSRTSFDATELALWTIVAGGSTGPALTVNPSREGFFVIPSGSGITESPTRPGIFVIGV